MRFNVQTKCTLLSKDLLLAVLSEWRFCTLNENVKFLFLWYNVYSTVRENEGDNNIIKTGVSNSDQLT